MLMIYVGIVVKLKVYTVSWIVPVRTTCVCVLMSLYTGHRLFFKTKSERRQSLEQEEQLVT